LAASVHITSPCDAH